MFKTDIAIIINKNAFKITNQIEDEKIENYSFTIDQYFEYTETDEHKELLSAKKYFPKIDLPIDLIPTEYLYRYEDIAKLKTNKYVPRLNPN